MFALIYKGKVVQIEKTLFQVYKDLQWIPILNGNHIEVGYLFDGETFSPPPPPTPRQEFDDVFRRAVKKIIVAILKYINGTITKVELGAVYTEIKDILETINE